jgi:hypothetical protein
MLMTTLIACLASSLPAHAAQPLGRLFTTAAERAALDARRAHGDVPPPAMVEAAPPPAPPPPITLNGIVKPSQGQPTVWLNTAPQTVQPSMLKPGRSPSGAVTVVSPAGKPVTLKAGQTYDMANGTVRDDDAP